VSNGMDGYNYNGYSAILNTFHNLLFVILIIIILGLKMAACGVLTNVHLKLYIQTEPVFWLWNPWNLRTLDRMRLKFQTVLFPTEQCLMWKWKVSIVDVLICLLVFFHSNFPLYNFEPMCFSLDSTPGFSSGLKTVIHVKAGTQLVLTAIIDMTNRQRLPSWIKW